MRLSQLKLAFARHGSFVTNRESTNTVSPGINSNLKSYQESSSSEAEARSPTIPKGPITSRNSSANENLKFDLPAALNQNNSIPGSMKIREMDFPPQQQTGTGLVSNIGNASEVGNGGRQNQNCSETASIGPGSPESSIGCAPANDKEGNNQKWASLVLKKYSDGSTDEAQTHVPLGSSSNSKEMDVVDGCTGLTVSGGLEKCSQSVENLGSPNHARHDSKSPNINKTTSQAHDHLSMEETPLGEERVAENGAAETILTGARETGEGVADLEHSRDTASSLQVAVSVSRVNLTASAPSPCPGGIHAGLLTASARVNFASSASTSSSTVETHVTAIPISDSATSTLNDSTLDGSTDTVSLKAHSVLIEPPSTSISSSACLDFINDMICSIPDFSNPSSGTTCELNTTTRMSTASESLSCMELSEEPLLLTSGPSSPIPMSLIAPIVSPNRAMSAVATISDIDHQAIFGLSLSKLKRPPSSLSSASVPSETLNQDTLSVETSSSARSQLDPFDSLKVGASKSPNLLPASYGLQPEAHLPMEIPPEYPLKKAALPQQLVSNCALSTSSSYLASTIVKSLTGTNRRSSRPPAPQQPLCNSVTTVRSVVAPISSLPRQTTSPPMNSLGHSSTTPTTTSIGLTEQYIVPHSTVESHLGGTPLARRQSHIPSFLLPTSRPDAKPLSIVDFPLKTSGVPGFGARSVSTSSLDLKLILAPENLPKYAPESPASELDFEKYPAGGYTCKECGDSFGLMSSLEFHLQRRSVLFQASCLVCRKTYTFPNRCMYLRHIREHKESPSPNMVNPTGSFMRNMSLRPFTSADIDEWFNSPAFQLCLDHGNLLEKEQHLAQSGPSAKLPNDLAAPSGIGTELNISTDIPMVSASNVLRNSPQPNVSQGVPAASLISPKLGVGMESREVPSAPCSSLAVAMVKCPECSAPFPMNGPALRDHFAYNMPPNQKQFICPHERCQAVYFSPCSFKAHQRCHDANASPYVCAECGSILPSARALSCHVMDHRTAPTVLDAWRCTKCYTFYSSKDALLMHTATVHCEAYYKCQGCPMAFKSPSNFEEHKRVNHLESPNTEVRQISKCPQCDTVFQLREQLVDHLKSHPNMVSSFTVYRCPVCGRLMENKSGLVAHFRNIHKINIDQSQVQEAKINLDAATKQQPPLARRSGGPANGRKDFPSSTLRAAAPRRSLPIPPGVTRPLNHAIRSTAPSSQVHMHRCRQPDCGAIFSSPVAQMRHLSMFPHSNIRPRGGQCEACKTTFPSREVLWQHGEIKHLSSQGKSVCLLCNNLMFETEEGLSLHLEQHVKLSTAQPYRCELHCSQTFDSPGPLVSHLRTVHGLAPGKCYLCCKDFSCFGDLEAHKLICPLKRLAQVREKAGGTLKRIQNANFGSITNPSRPEFEPTAKRPMVHPSGPHLHLHPPSISPRLPAALPGNTPARPAVSFSCCVCNARFGFRREFIAHIQVHRQPFEFQCLECGKPFAASPQLCSHLMFDHKISKPGAYLSENELANPRFPGGGSNVTNLSKPAPSSVAISGNSTFFARRTQSNSAVSPISLITPGGPNFPALTACGPMKTPAASGTVVTPFSPEGKAPPGIEKCYECDVCKHQFKSEHSLHGHMRVHGLRYLEQHQKETTF